MDKVKRFFELKEQWKVATQEQRKAIDTEINALLTSLSDDETRALETGVSGDLKRIGTNIEEIKEIAVMRDKLSSILPLISVSHLSKKYFNRSPQWFYQRLNGNYVNGKPAHFSVDEIKTLKHALSDISSSINSISLAL